jgi:hypothetical protein
MLEPIVQELSALQRQVSKMEAQEQPGYATVSQANVSSPPSDAELDSAFGQPVDVGAGFLGLVDDAGAGSTVWLVVSDGTNWWYEQLTKAT